MCALPLFLAGPAAADRKGLEGVETTTFAKLCGAEFFGGGSQEPAISGKLYDCFNSVDLSGPKSTPKEQLVFSVSPCTKHMLRERLNTSRNGTCL